MLVEVDAEQFTSDRFPLVMGVCLGVVFVMVGVRYRAVFVPVKLLFTVALPMAFVYGAAVEVYQNGLLNRLGWSSLASKGGVGWIVPYTTAFFLVGLALHYDMLLFSRIHEYRQTGDYTAEGAILMGVERVGAVIATSGICVACAFAGMFVTSSSFLIEFGFVLVVGAVFDAALVRVMLVPALLSLGDWMNWWPSDQCDACTYLRSV